MDGYPDFNITKGEDYNNPLFFFGFLIPICTTSSNVFSNITMSTTIINYRNRFVTQYITHLNIWEALSGTLSPLSTHDRLILVWTCRSRSAALLNPVEGSRSAPARSSNQNQSVMGWQWEQGPWKRFPYVQVSASV